MAARYFSSENPTDTRLQISQTCWLTSFLEGDIRQDYIVTNKKLHIKVWPNKDHTLVKKMAGLHSMKTCLITA